MAGKVGAAEWKALHLCKMRDMGAGGNESQKFHFLFRL